MKNTAWKDGDNEIETYRSKSQEIWQKIFFIVFMVIVMTAFILGEIYVF